MIYEVFLERVVENCTWENLLIFCLFMSIFFFLGRGGKFLVSKKSYHKENKGLVFIIKTSQQHGLEDSIWNNFFFFCFSFPY